MGEIDDLKVNDGIFRILGIFYDQCYLLFRPKVPFLIEKLSQSYNISCTLKNEETRQSELSYHENIVISQSSKVFTWILCKKEIFEFSQGLHILFGRLLNCKQTKHNKNKHY